MRSVIAVTPLLCVCLGAACAPIKKTGTDSSVSSTNRNLPVVGSWIAESYDGYFAERNGEIKSVHLVTEHLRVNDWQLESQLDSNGNGYLKTKIDCKLAAGRRVETSSGIPVPRSFKVFPDALQLRTCDNGQPVEHHQTHTVIAAQKKSVPRNLGIHGVERSLSDLCSELRGSRFIRQETGFLRNSGSTGCVGFADAAAQKLSMIVVPDGEIYALRIAFRRIK
jgi:hypothetical protein